MVLNGLGHVCSSNKCPQPYGLRHARWCSHVDAHGTYCRVLRGGVQVAAVDSTYDPFGRGGAGAPLKDGAGNVIADYRALARGDASPDATDRRARTTPTQLTGNAHTPGNPQTGVSGGVWGAAEPAPAQHAPGGATGSGASPQHYARTTGADGPGPASQAERDHESSKKQQTYQEFLREQMEEKERLKQVGASAVLPKGTYPPPLCV